MTGPTPITVHILRNQPKVGYNANTRVMSIGLNAPNWKRDLKGSRVERCVLHDGLTEADVMASNGSLYTEVIRAHEDPRNVKFELA